MEKKTIRQIEELIEKISQAQEEKEKLISEFAKAFKERLLPPETILILATSKYYEEYTKYFKYYLTPEGDVKVYSAIDDSPYRYSETLEFDEFLWEIPVELIPKMFETYLSNLQETLSKYEEDINLLKKAIECLQK